MSRKLVIPSKFTLKSFIEFLDEYVKCEVITPVASGECEIIVAADNISPGRKVPLIAREVGKTVKVCEVPGDYFSDEEANIAMGNALSYGIESEVNEWLDETLIFCENISVKEFKF